MPSKYSDVLADWLVDFGYTTFFYVGGGGVMHLLESCSRKMKGIPVIHEVAAGIAAEYFNETTKNERAFALVTSGPGLTNVITAIGGAWLESRELLVMGGQVKSADLSHGKLRQRGIQEIDGSAIAKPICLLSKTLEDVLDKQTFFDMSQTSARGRKGPVFIEVPLDIQARTVELSALEASVKSPANAVKQVPEAELNKIVERVRNAKRPMILLGGGVDRNVAAKIGFEKMGVPVTTTWNGTDRISADNPAYFGRPNTWGQRYANLLLQQADVLVALGTRLGLQQTGFNWQEFVPVGKVVQVDCDKAELDKGHPKVDMPVCGDANQVLQHLAKSDLGTHEEWLSFCREVKQALPTSEACNTTGEGFVSPFEFALLLSKVATKDDLVIPCSSGGAFTTIMQAFQQKAGQVIVTNHGLASMGYGLSGSIGAAFAGQGRRTILIEGDGGFSQNIQEIGTAAINKLNLKIFIYDDNGYASIRMTQRSYFGGRYVGCDIKTGLGFPNWEKLFGVWDVPVIRLKPGFEEDPAFKKLFEQQGVAAFIVPIDPQQTYFPKIASRVTATGSMESNPLHKMSPDLDDALYAKVARYLK